jgi:hypothetical protein
LEALSAARGGKDGIFPIFEYVTDKRQYHRVSVYNKNRFLWTLFYLRPLSVPGGELADQGIALRLEENTLVTACGTPSP